MCGNVASVNLGAEDLAERQPKRRLGRLFDPGTRTDLHAPDDSGVYAARGQIDGQNAIGFGTDGAVMGGAMGERGCEHIVAAYEAAVAEGLPIIGLWQSGGARLAEGV